MKTASCLPVATAVYFLAILSVVFAPTQLSGRQAPTQINAGSLPQPVNWTTAEDHRNMMEQLGIKALRPGPSGKESNPNHANYDESKANPYPDLPDALTLKNGSKVTTAAKWLDHQGSYMAAVAAGPVFRLLGAKDLGTSDDYRSEKMPPVNVGLLDGQLAWRQHDGGHTDGPNWKYFIPWADKFLKHTTPDAPRPVSADQAAVPAYQPVPRSDENSQIAHAQLLDKARRCCITIYFEGDSITRRWGATDYPDLLANWRQNFFGWNAANFGWGGDTTQNILWRLNDGELDGVNPKIIVLLAGTNNVGKLESSIDDEAAVTDITLGLQAILHTLQTKAPDATIIVTGIFPRNDNRAALPRIAKINDNLSKLADGKRIRFLNISDRLADQDGNLFDGMTNDGLHPTIKGYQVWADSLKPIFTELLGPPKSEDHAPPPTGDPKARKSKNPARSRQIAGDV